MEKLLPDVLKELWQTVDENQLTGERYYLEQERLLDDYRRTWRQALVLEAHDDLKESLLRELGSYLGREDLAEIERRGQNAMTTAKHEWEGKVNPSDRHAVEQYYDESQAAMFELVYWHALEWDTSPLAYVTASFCPPARVSDLLGLRGRRGLGRDSLCPPRIGSHLGRHKFAHVALQPVAFRHKRFARPVLGSQVLWPSNQSF